MKRQLKWQSLFLMVAVLFGGLVRVMPALMARFPINDGGMFLTMAGELSSNGYKLPVETFYNGWNIPFAYPPLGLYLASGLSDLGHVSLLDVFLWLPPLLSILTIPAFYLFSRALLSDELLASLATIFFALTPGAYDWHVMGGGVTRAAGVLFLLLALYFVTRMFQEDEMKFIPPAIIFCSCAVLSHPEVGLHTAGICAVLWLFHGRTRKGILSAFSVAIGVVIVTAPWWLTVILQHGWAPFTSALMSGGHTRQDWLSTLPGLFSYPGYIPILPILWVAGLLYAVIKKSWQFVILFFIPVFIDPRSGMVAHLVLSMLAASVVLDAIPALARWLHPRLDDVSVKHVSVMAVPVLGLILLVESGLGNYRLVNTTVTVGEKQAMTWLEDNLPPDQDFYIITGHRYSMSDPVQEWFPVLSRQHSQTTLQGLEWTLGSEFWVRLEALASLQACTSIVCLDSFEAQSGLTYGYIWFNQAGSDDPGNGGIRMLIPAIRGSDKFQQIYESDSVLIFKRVE